MSSQTDSTDAKPFDSLADMQAAHDALADNSKSPTLLLKQQEQVTNFVRRGVATGRILDREDRQPAQGLITFWVTRLSSAVRTASKQASAESTTGSVALAEATLPKFGETLLEPFDQKTVTQVANAANEWEKNLSNDDRTILRRIMLRMVRLPRGKEAFEPVPATRATLYDVDPSAENVDKLIAELERKGIVRVTKGDSPDQDGVALRFSELMTKWATFKNWLNRRKEGRQKAIAWKAAGEPSDDLLTGEDLDELRSYHDRDEAERLRVEMSRRKEWAALEEVRATRLLVEETRRREELALKQAEAEQRAKRWLYAALALTLLVAGLIVWVFWTRDDWIKAEAAATANKAKLEQLKSEEETKLAEAKRDEAVRLRKETQQLAEMVAVTRALAAIGNGDKAEKEIAVVKLKWLAENDNTDPGVREFLNKNKSVWNQTGTSDPDPANLRKIQSAALNTARQFKAELLGGSAEVQERLKGERRVIFEAARTCANGIVVKLARQDQPLGEAAPYLEEFWVLYWGEMGLVEGPAVTSAMAGFGRVLDTIVAKVKGNTGKEAVESTVKGLSYRQMVESATKEGIKGATKEGMKGMNEMMLQAAKTAEAALKVAAALSAKKVDKADREALEKALKRLNEALDAELQSDVALNRPFDMAA